MLTHRQRDLLVFIDQHLKLTGVCPSFEEMAAAINVRSKSGIHRLINALEERGFLARRHKRARALEVLRLPLDVTARDAIRAAPSATVVPPNPNFGEIAAADDFASYCGRAANDGDAVQIPFHGRIAAGLVVNAPQLSGNNVTVPIALLAGKADSHFALRVDGDSMAGYGIHHGDIVVILRNIPPQDGQIGVASGGGGATLKCVRCQGSTITLESGNNSCPPLHFPVEAVTLHGTLVALLRCY